MDPIKVDENGELRLKSLVPGAYYEPDVLNPDEITLRRIDGPAARKWSREEALMAIEQCPLQFDVSWDELKRQTRG